MKFLIPAFRAKGVGAVFTRSRVDGMEIQLYLSFLAFKDGLNSESCVRNDKCHRILINIFVFYSCV